MKRGGEITSKKKTEEPPKAEKLMLYFPQVEIPTLEKGLPKPIQKAAIELEELLKWFESFKVDSIELSIEATVGTGSATGLLVSAQGKGGITVTLKPK